MERQNAQINKTRYISERDYLSSRNGKNYRQGVLFWLDSKGWTHYKGVHTREHLERPKDIWNDPRKNVIPLNSKEKTLLRSRIVIRIEAIFYPWVKDFVTVGMCKNNDDSTLIAYRTESIAK